MFQCNVICTRSDISNYSRVKFHNRYRRVYIEITNIDRYPKFLIGQNCIKKGFCSTALAIDTFYFKYCSVVTQYSR